jgi:hypothetical protein
MTHRRACPPSGPKKIGLAWLLSGSTVVASALACRNVVVEPVRIDAGPESGEGEGEGDGDGCEAEPPAVNVRVADAAGFVYCDEGTVVLTLNGQQQNAQVVPIDGDGCRHQGGFGVSGTYIIDVGVAGFAPQQTTVTVPADACDDPITTTLQITVGP